MLKPENSSIAELLVLLMLADEHSELVFEKRDRFIYPVCDKWTINPFPACLGGRCINHYRKLCNIRFPTQNGQFTCTMKGPAANFAFAILPRKGPSIARLSVLDTKIDSESCSSLLLECLTKSKKRRTLFERIHMRVHRWWAGEDIYRRYWID